MAKFPTKSIDDVRRLVSLLEESPACTNGTVIGLLLKSTVQKGKTKSFCFTSTADKLSDKFNQRASSSVIRQVRNVFASYKHLIKHISTNWAEIKKFLEGHFLFQPITSARPKNIVASTPAELSPERVSQSTSRSSTNSNSAVTTPVKTRTDCHKCPSAKKLNFALKKNLLTEKKKATVAKSNTANLKKLYKIRETRQKVKRQGETLEKLRPLLKNKDIQLDYLQKKLNKALSLNEELNKEIQVLKSQNKKLAKKLESSDKVSLTLKKELQETHLLVDYLQLECEDGKENKERQIFQTIEGKQYAPLVRRCIYKQLLCDVPIANCGPLLEDFVKTILMKDVVRVPSAATCSQMAYELGVMSTLQLADFMMGSSNLCLSWDATSLEGAHVNELHVTANDRKCLILDVRHLAGGKTADYVSHIISALSEAAATYARFKKLDPDEVFKALKSSISATLTDRAAVNACVTRQLKDELESEIVQLNCNVHPLDSIARDVRKALENLDKSHGIKSECFGNDCAAANVINAVSVLRFKDGAGDPLGFKNVLRQNDLPLGTFVRYVGNRLHILFHLAGVLVTHREKLLAFTKEQCTGGGQLRVRLMKDLGNDRIMAQVWALGVLGKVLTGPWMSRFYSSQMSNLQMGPDIRRCVRTLESWLEEPTALLTPTEDVFGANLQPEDNVLSALQLFVGDEPIQEASLKVSLNASLAVLKRQLHAFLEGDFVNPAEEILTKAAAAPTHNMTSERNLGCYDRLWRRAPNASAGFITGKVKCKMNKTVEWFDAMGEDSRLELIRFLVCEAKEDRFKKFVQHKDLVQDIGKRREEVSKQRSKSDLSAMGRHVKKVIETKDVNLLPTSCTQALKNRLVQFIDDNETVVGTLIIHTLDNVDWYARVLNSFTDVKSKQKKLELSYWSISEPESSGADFITTAVQFYADAMLGNIAFL